MPIFGPKKVIVAFLNNLTLKLALYEFTKDGVRLVGQEKILFPESVVKDSTIIDRNVIGDEIYKFLGNKPEWKKVPVLLAIPEEKIFLKGFELELGDLERKEALKKEFVSEVPFIEEDLIVKEKLSGKILETAAIPKQYIGDLYQAFSHAQMKIGGSISLPQVLARSSLETERSILVTFYDNDLVLALAQNACVLFSETAQLTPKDIAKQILGAVNHFVRHPYVKGVKLMSLVLDPEVPSESLKVELEKAGFTITSIVKTSVLDLVAEYYRNNQPLRPKWDLLYVKPEPLLKRIKNIKWKEAEKLLVSKAKEKKKYFIYAGSGLLVIGLIVGGFIFYRLFLGPQIEKSLPAVEEGGPLPPVEGTTTAPAPSVVPETPSAPTALMPSKKEDFPLRISNGTLVAGEASRLRTILVNNGFTVISVGNYEDQNQTATTIFASAQVPDDIISGLRKVLEIYYQEVLVSLSPVAEEVIHVVIGRKK